MLALLAGPIISSTWGVESDSDGNRPRSSRSSSASAKIPRAASSSTKFCREALTCLTYGFALQERVFEVMDGMMVLRTPRLSLPNLRQTVPHRRIRGLFGRCRANSLLHARRADGDYPNRQPRVLRAARDRQHLGGSVSAPGRLQALVFQEQVLPDRRGRRSSLRGAGLAGGVLGEHVAQSSRRTLPNS